MLLDLCDVLEEANVKTLGHTFLELCHTLNIQPPLVDPSLYIHVRPAPVSRIESCTSRVSLFFRDSHRSSSSVTRSRWWQRLRCALFRE